MTAAASRPVLLRSAVLSVIDQAWLSLLNLALGLILIRLTAKEAYGVYAQLYVAGIFAATIAEALITNPLTTLAARAQDGERAALITHLRRFQGRLSTAVGILFGIVCAGVAVWADIPQPAWLALGFGLYVKTNAAREYRRSVLFVMGSTPQVLRTDVQYGVAVLAGTGLLVWMGTLFLPAVFGMLALANVVALMGTRLPQAAAAGAAPDYREAVAQAWKRGRLGLPGAVLAWIINYSYLYVAAAWLGATATADLNASRLLLMPIAMTVMAWSRVARPMIGRQLAQNDSRGLFRLLLTSTAAVEAVTLAYVAVLWLALPWLQQHMLGEKYANVQPLVMGWGLYFAINATRSIGTAALMSADRYGATLAVAVVSLTLTLVSMNLTIPSYGAVGAIIALTIVETVSLVLIWSAWRRSMPKVAT